MKIGYFGDGKWAHTAFEKILADPELEIVFVVLRYNTQDKELRRMAERQNIPVLVHPNINSKEFINIIQFYNADIFVSMSFDQIFKNEIINIPLLKTINCHAGKLPFYRGRNILNWVLINDEKEFGITVHYIDEGIDTGDIILQRVFPITDDDTYQTLLNIAYDECANILYEALKMIQSGNVVRIRQDTIDPLGMYCGARTLGDEIITWDQTSREIFNFVRALNGPDIKATSYLRGEKIYIHDVKLFPEAKIYRGIPGQILGKTDDGFYVKTKDTFIEVKKFEYPGKIIVGNRLRKEIIE